MFLFLFTIYYFEELRNKENDKMFVIKSSRSLVKTFFIIILIIRMYYRHFCNFTTSVTAKYCQIQQKKNSSNYQVRTLIFSSTSANSRKSFKYFFEGYNSLLSYLQGLRSFAMGKRLGDGALRVRTEDQKAAQRHRMSLLPRVGS